MRLIYLLTLPGSSSRSFIDLLLLIGVGMKAIFYNYFTIFSAYDFYLWMLICRYIFLINFLTVFMISFKTSVSSFNV